MPKVLVVDDVPAVVKLLQLELGFQGFTVTTTLLEEDFAGIAESLKPAAIVLGSSTPTPEVYEALRVLKERTAAPILFVHAMGNDSDAALAFDMGADDAIGKPFNPEDIGLRLQGLIDEKFAEGSQLRRGQLRIDFLRRLVWRSERKIALGTSEWGLLLVMAKANGPVPPTELLSSVWGVQFGKETRYLMEWINRLRTNLGEDPSHPEIVLGSVEEGYWLAP